jgi:SCF-associated factor 1
VISDLQCGGWSTNLLTDKGVIYSAGALNGLTQWNARDELTALGFDAINNELPKARTAIRQFSSGRSHVLGLSDDGTIWSWHNAILAGCSVKFPGIDSTVLAVHGGWDKSSALIRGHGIVTWKIVTGSGVEASVTDNVVVPKTGYVRPRNRARLLQDHDPLADTVGEVTSYIVLEHYILFTTDLHKVFAYKNHSSTNPGFRYDIFELTELGDVKDVQGSFRNFAVFSGDGEVKIGNQEYLDACAFQSDEEPLPEIMIIPALQHTGVLQIAFGDYHYHALHANGSISSYGVEPGGCGALGLGGLMDMGLPHGMLRGIKNNFDGRGIDGIMLPHTYTSGRRIWFQKEQETWLRFLADGGKDPDEAKPRMGQVDRLAIAQGYISEWVEQMGSDWDKRPGPRKVDEDGLGAYFALSVAAAGWHSGALVLVNDKVVNAVRESCLEDIPARTPSPTSEPSSPVQARSRAGSLWDTARSWLGLQNADNPAGEGHADDARSEGSSTGTSDDQQLYGEGLPPRGKRWIWANQDFPRLTLDYGFQTPGSVTFSEWKTPNPIPMLRWTGDDRKLYGVSGWIQEEHDEDLGL